MTAEFEYSGLSGRPAGPVLRLLGLAAVFGAAIGVGT